MSVGNYSQPPPNLPPFPPPLFGAMPGYGPGFIPNVPPPLLPPSAPVSSQNQSPSLMLSTPPQHQAPPPGNQTTPTGPSHSLQLIRQELQTELDTYGVTDPLEVEFNTNVKRLMDSCSKDSIAVSVCCVPVYMYDTLLSFFTFSLVKAGYSPMPGCPTSVLRLQSTFCGSKHMHTHAHTHTYLYQLTMYYLPAGLWTALELGSPKNCTSFTSLMMSSITGEL